MLPSYLSQFTSCKTLYVVGPFYQGQVLSEPCVFIDRGAHFRPAPNFGFSVGDNDSFLEALDHVLPISKDVSDLAFLLRDIPSHFTDIRLLGFLGERRDHELGTFFEVIQLLTNRRGVVIWDNEEWVALSETSFMKEHRDVFSVFSFIENSNVKIEGNCLYPFQGRLKPLSTHGLSNEGRGFVKITADKPILICFGRLNRDKTSV